MNFLRHFNFEIRPAERRILVEHHQAMMPPTVPLADLRIDNT
jgi:hypothetical protein